jgi:hypothetical protein
MKMLETGIEKQVTEMHVVEANSFSDSEQMIYNELSSYVNGDLNICSIRKSSYKEIVFSDNDDDNKFYHVVMKIITTNEKNGKEKLSSINYLIQAKDIYTAFKYINVTMQDTMVDYSTASVSETTIMDVLQDDKLNNL